MHKVHVLFGFSFGSGSKDPGMVNKVTAQAILKLNLLFQDNAGSRPLIATQWEVDNAMSQSGDLRADLRVCIPDGKTYIDTRYTARRMIALLSSVKSVSPDNICAHIVAHPRHIGRCATNLTACGVQEIALHPIRELYDPDDPQEHVRSRKSFMVHERYAVVYDYLRNMF